MDICQVLINPYLSHILAVNGLTVLPATYSLPSSHFPAHALEAMLPCISHKPFTSLTSTVQTVRSEETHPASLLQCTIPI